MLEVELSQNPLPKLQSVHNLTKDPKPLILVQLTSDLCAARQREKGAYKLRTQHLFPLDSAIFTTYGELHLRFFSTKVDWNVLRFNLVGVLVICRLCQKIFNPTDVIAS